MVSLVAPFTGAWVETITSPHSLAAADHVAPFTGAWVETSPYPPDVIGAGLSRPSRARGLKQYQSLGDLLKAIGRALHGRVG